MTPTRRRLTLATDYDGTLAENERIDAPTVAALERLRGAGGSIVLVTGRILDELAGVCPRLDLFDRVVAENGAVLHRPADGSTRVLADPPPAAFVAALHQEGIAPLAVGQVVIATWKPHDAPIRRLIESTGLPLEVVLNKRAVMILPEGVTKATGLRHALDELGVDPADVAAVGDAENDLDFLDACGLAVAVANALPVVKARAGRVTAESRGRGVVELIDALLDGTAWRVDAH